VLLSTARVSGLAEALLVGLSPCPRAARSVHDPGKTVLDLAIAIGLDGDCLTDIAVVRAQPELFGPVASDPTVSRLLDALAEQPGEAIAAIRSARAQARSRVWAHRTPFAEEVQAQRVVVDLDATLIGAHSEKEHATPNYKRGFGSTRCLPSSTTAPVAPVNRWPGCCARAGRMPTTPATRSRSSMLLWPSCPTAWVRGCCPW